MGEAEPIDVGKPGGGEALWQVSDVDEDAIRLGLGHLVDNAAGDDVSRSEFAFGNVVWHEAVAISVAQQSTLSSNRLRY